MIAKHSGDNSSKLPGACQARPKADAQHPQYLSISPAMTPWKQKPYKQGQGSDDQEQAQGGVV